MFPQCGGFLESSHSLQIKKHLLLFRKQEASFEILDILRLVSVFVTRWGLFPAVDTSLRFDGSQKHWQELSWSLLLGLECVSVRKEQGRLLEGHLVHQAFRAMRICSFVVWFIRPRVAHQGLSS